MFRLLPIAPNVNIKVKGDPGKIKYLKIQSTHRISKLPYKEEE